MVTDTITEATLTTELITTVVMAIMLPTITGRPLCIARLMSSHRRFIPCLYIRVVDITVLRLAVSTFKVVILALVWVSK